RHRARPLSAAVRSASCALYPLSLHDALPISETGAFGRPLDQPGNIREHEALLDADADDAEVRVQRRERIVGDLRPRRGQRARQRRLAGIRRAEQANVGEDLERELQVPLLAGLAARELPRRPVHAALERRVPAPSPAAARDEQPVAGLDQVAELLAGIEIDDLGADRHRDEEIRARRPGHVPAAARLTVLGLESPLDAKVRERVQAFLRDEIDAAARTAVTAVGAALRDELLAAKADRAVAAAAGFDANIGLVDELHGVGTLKT